MTNEIKVGDVLHCVTAVKGAFTEGEDYEVIDADGWLTHVINDSGSDHGMTRGWLEEYFTVIRTIQAAEIKVGSIVRVISAEPQGDYGDSTWYTNGDIFEVGEVWHSGITTTQGIQMWDHEVEKVTEQVVVDALESIATTLSDAVKQPNHYTQGKFETIEVIEEITKGYEDGFVAYAVGNAQKYLARAPFKHDTPLEDLKKAERYLQYAIARQESLESQ